MTILFENETPADPLPQPEAFSEKVISCALDVIGCPYEAQVSVLLTGPEEIREINREYRQIDTPTDVLSFPGVDFPSPGNFDFLEEEELESSCFHPESGELLLGDIVINVPQARAQAEEYGHSFEREFAFLLTHSVLHLCGYDHMEEDDRLLMEEMQRKILDRLGITRDTV